MPNNFKNEEQRKHWNAYNLQYSKKKYRAYNIKLDRERDKDIIEYLESGESATTLIRDALRAKIGSK